MAIVIAVAGLKGGVGKSTIAITLATTLHRAGHKTIIVDADPQATCRMWAARAAALEHDGPAVVAIDPETLRRDLPTIAAAADVVIVDSPPRLGGEVRAAMFQADFVLMPTTPGAADVWALRETIALLFEVRKLRDVAGAVVLNRAERTGLATTARRALEALAGVDLLDVRLGSRVAFGEAVLAGQGVVDHAPTSEAAHEARRLTKAVLGAIAAAQSVAA